MRCPFATWRGSPNVGGTPVRPARGLVVHVEVGTENGTIACFENPAFKASAHFGCDTDGSLDQFVDTDAEAWAEVAGNPGWISVETAGYPTDPLTPAQVEAVGTLFAWLRGVYGFPAQTCDHDGTGLTTHAHYPSGLPDPAWGGHPCPGAIRSAQLPEILAAPGGSDDLEESMAIAKNPTDEARGWTRLLYEIATNDEPTADQLSQAAFIGVTSGFEAMVTAVLDSPQAQRRRAARDAAQGG